MPVLWPGNRTPAPLKVSNILKNIRGKRVYAFTSKVIAFVSNGNLYVTPFTNESLEIIRDAGYKLQEFFVPFSRGDQPLDEYGERWHELIAAKRCQVAPATAVSL